jgi:hypothetical protein
VLLGGSLAALSLSVDVVEASGALVGVLHFLVVNTGVMKAAGGGAEGGTMVGAVGSAAVKNEEPTN